MLPSLNFTSNNLNKNDFFFYQKAKLLHFILITLFISLMLSVVSNLTYLNQPKIAFAAAVCASINLLAFVYFHKSQSITYASWIALLITAFMLILITINGKGQRDTSALLILFPFISFQLLSTRSALVSHSAFSIIIMSLFVLNTESWQLNHPYSSYLNISVALLFSGAISYHLSTTVEKSSNSLYESSMTDALTSLWNRKMFTLQVNNELKRLKRSKIPLSMALFDIDFFKKVNDTYGHLEGDRVLISFTSILRSSIRDTDFVARWGGEEFVILFTDTDIHGAKLKVSKILDAIREYEIDVVGKITASVGVSEFSNTDSLESRTKVVDDALYKAKENGRDQLVSG